MDGWMDGWLDGWMDGWMDGAVSAKIVGCFVPCICCIGWYNPTYFIPKYNAPEYRRYTDITFQ